jgi:hypothetical protein
VSSLHLLGLALLALAHGPVVAQSPDSGLVSAVRSLEPGTHVRLEASQVGRVQGRLLVVSDTTVTLARQEMPITVRLPDVERLWVRGRATGLGALIGTGVGVVAGAVFGALIGQVACEPVDGGDCTPVEVAAVTGLLGGAGGALLGAGIGFVIPKWRLRFP